MLKGSDKTRQVGRFYHAFAVKVSDIPCRRIDGGKRRLIPQPESLREERDVVEGQPLVQRRAS
jgi:hypothetical protein